MKVYPAISKKILDNIDIYAFDKLDGSNIRVEWTSKKGFWKFGSRHQLLDETHELLGEAPSLIVEKYKDHLEPIFKENRYEKVICFFEFFGPSSFAGNHIEEPHDVVLFDVNPYKKGIVSPSDFIGDYGHLDIPRLLYHGKANSTFQAAVKGSELEGMTFEGVVCKGMNGKVLRMFKIKSQKWLDKLKDFCNHDEDLFEKLS